MTWELLAQPGDSPTLIAQRVQAFEADAALQADREVRLWLLSLGASAHWIEVATARVQSHFADRARNTAEALWLRLNPLH
jgi:hypothetical protein